MGKDRYLIIHADDGGLCPSVNQAIIDCLKSNIVTSTSLMVPAPYFREIIDYLVNNPHNDVGIHLTLTCEDPRFQWTPISPPEKITSIVNKAGHLVTKKEFLARANQADVEIEIRAQIEKALQIGIKPSHLDIHQGVIFHNPDIFKTYLKLALEYKISPLLLKYNERTSKLMDFRGVNIGKTIFSEIAKLGLPALDFLFMIDFKNYKDFDHIKQKYLQVIDELPVGCSQIIIHPSLNGKDLKEVSKISKQRVFDFLVFTNDEIKQFIDKKGINLISWREFNNKQYNK